MRRLKVRGACAVYHCMTRTVNGERLFEDRDKEMLRKMLWQLADFSGVEILTYCIMSNHFHVLVRVDDGLVVSDRELLRRYAVLYPQATKYQTATVKEIAKVLQQGGEEADALRKKLLARMGDVSEFMKAVKQRFSVWFNRTHGRYGTLWSERFKSVLVEGKGNALQTVAAYIDLNPVRAELVEDPKDYRFCGYAEAVACSKPARKGIAVIWANYADGSERVEHSSDAALSDHRSLIFGKRADQVGSDEVKRAKVLRQLERADAPLPRHVVLRCRIRYFTDGAILGSREFVQSHVDSWQEERRRKFPPKVHPFRGADWGNLSVIRGLRKQVFS